MLNEKKDFEDDFEGYFNGNFKENLKGDFKDTFHFQLQQEDFQNLHGVFQSQN